MKPPYLLRRSHTALALVSVGAGKVNKVTSGLLTALNIQVAMKVWPV